MLAHVARLALRIDPEVELVYSGAEFNEEFGPTALVALARARADARRVRHARGHARYRRRHGQSR